MKLTFEALTMVFPHESKMELLLARNDAGELVGTATVKNFGKVIEFNRLCVAYGHRDSGVGRAIVEHMATAARTAGTESLTGLVHPKNEKALGFYRHLGFFEALQLEGDLRVMTLKL